MREISSLENKPRVHEQKALYILEEKFKKFVNWDFFLNLNFD
jgi:hypothetical protein